MRWSCLLLASAWAGGTGAPVDLLVAEEGDGISVTVLPTADPVAVPACRAIGWERFDDASGRYSAVPGEACGPLAPAIWVGKEGISARYVPDKAGFQVVRPVVVYGVGCRRGLPLPLAGCTKIEAWRGPNASLRKAPAEK